MFKHLRDIFKSPSEQLTEEEQQEQELLDAEEIEEADEDESEVAVGDEEAAIAVEDDGEIAVDEDDGETATGNHATIIEQKDLPASEVPPEIEDLQAQSKAEAAVVGYEEYLAEEPSGEMPAIVVTETPIEDQETIEIAVEEPEEQEVAEEEWEEEPEPEAVPAETRSSFNLFRQGLQRTRGLFSRVNSAFSADEITDDLWDELEESLLAADVGAQLTEKLMETLRQRAHYEHMKRGSEVREALKEELQILLGVTDPLVFSDTSAVTVYLVVGVNGVGKTTSIAKLGNLLKRDGHRVMLAAGDTFRAAAVEQLKTWGDRLKVPVVSHQQGADPAAVVFDAMESAQARKTDVLIVDTAGRLHTKSNLMEELKKISKVLARYDSEAPHEVLLVLDATTGQNAIAQAKTFVKDADVSGIILTKLDGTARGGVVFSISSELGLPIKFVGTGEKVQDIAPFDPTEFVDALFEE
jgi:fused signal recognition particle receptor